VPLVAEPENGAAVPAAELLEPAVGADAAGRAGGALDLVAGGGGLVGRKLGVAGRAGGVPPGALVTSGLAGGFVVDEPPNPDRPAALGRVAPPAATARVAAVSAAPPTGFVASAGLDGAGRAALGADVESGPADLPGGPPVEVEPLPDAPFGSVPDVEPLLPLPFETDRPSAVLPGRSAPEPPLEPVDTLGDASVVIGVVPPPVAGRDGLLAPGR
jgi:hypothetical protein